MNMKKIQGLLLLIVLLLIPMNVQANSSWVWISERRPYDLLPMVIVVTLLIEILGINFVAGIKKFIKVSGVVIGVNIFSFAFPYLCEWFNCLCDGIYEFPTPLEAGPYYTVGSLFLFATIVIEVPIVYKVFQKDATSKRRLLATAIVVNVITTAFTAIIERMLCYGMW